MNPDYGAKTEKELATFVENYRRQGQISTDAYRNLLRAYELKRGKGLDLEKTLHCITEAAKARKFVSYKQVAEASDMPMAKARLRLPDHLRTLCDYARSRGLPLLSAIVVNIDGVSTGVMNTEARTGFIRTARDMGFEIDDEDAFVSAEQAKIFTRFTTGLPA